MAVVDFKEIPSAKGGYAGQDTWAFFARDFFMGLGLTIEQGPDRGPDLGKDLIISEERTGQLGARSVKWLVSCKHNAYTGNAVSDRDEIDILGRVRKFKADGFIGFYSTLPSAALAETLHRHKGEIEIVIYDSARIEEILVNNQDLQEIFQRYLPESFRKWQSERKSPVLIWDSYSPLPCKVCGKDLLKERSGIVALAEKRTSKRVTEIVDIYWACKGNCDRAVEEQFDKRQLLTVWDDIEDLAIPFIFLRWIMGFMNDTRDGNTIFTEESYAKFKEFSIRVAQVVLRGTSKAERERIKDLMSIPSGFGGLG